MSSFGCDISFLDERDSNFWDIGKNLEVVAAKLLLNKESEALTEAQIEILDSLHNNMAVRYNDGIFRVLKVAENQLPSEDDDKRIWEVEIEGNFTADDPNGHVLNGWKDDELSQREVNVSGAISDLEI